MAFENVDVTSLKQALTTCKTYLNKSSVSDVISSISNNSVWQAESKDKLKKSLEKLKDVRYKELRDTLDKYIQVAGYIEKYKEIEQENINLQKQHSSLSNNLYKKETYSVTTYDENGNEIVKEETRTVKDYDVQSRMVSIESKINSNRNEMNSIKNNVANAI